jgi:hypothetical protein
MKMHAESERARQACDIIMRNLPEGESISVPGQLLLDAYGSPVPKACGGWGRSLDAWLEHVSKDLHVERLPRGKFRLERLPR